jgi:RimJ/RimL family protein N-acetyltransferase
MSFTDTPTLSNDLVTVESLAQRHRNQLAAAVNVGELWRLWYTHIPSPAAMTDEIARRTRLQEEGRGAYWAVIDPRTGDAVGMTSYLNPDPENRRLEIGSTWLSRDAQGTGMNPATKLLLLSRAFDDLGCIAVEFRVHWHNHQSRRAVERLGAKQDGVLRNHTIFANGTVRDTVVYSIIDAEWPTVKYGLQQRAAAHTARS